MELENLSWAVDAEIGTITFTRVAALNALNAATLGDLDSALSAAIDAGARVLVLTGAGKAFVAGADIAAMRTMDAAAAEAFGRRGNELFRRLELLPIPVIAAVNGFALGGGCELAMACDFIYASERAKFGQPEVNLGLIAGFGGTQRLPRLVGYGPAMELLLTGRMIDAAEALRIGLVNRLCAPDALLDEVYATARELLTKGPVAVRETKRLVQQTREASLGSGLAQEIATFGQIFETSDRVEGLSAFLDKRAARFTGA